MCKRENFILRTMSSEKVYSSHSSVKVTWVEEMTENQLVLTSWPHSRNKRTSHDYYIVRIASFWYSTYQSWAEADLGFS